MTHLNRARTFPSLSTEETISLMYAVSSLISSKYSCSPRTRSTNGGKISLSAANIAKGKGNKCIYHFVDCIYHLRSVNVNSIYPWEMMRLCTATWSCHRVFFFNLYIYILLICIYILLICILLIRIYSMRNY